MLSDPEEIFSLEPERAPKRVVFLTYQRTTFTDALRAATSLRQHGAYAPMFLVCAGRMMLVELEMRECRRRGIACVTEEEVLTESWRISMASGQDISRYSKGASRIHLIQGAELRGAPLWLKLLQRTGMFWAILSRRIGEERCARISNVWRRTSLGHWFLRRSRRRVFRLVRGGVSRGLFAALLRAELNYRRILQRLAPHVVCLSEDIPEIFSPPFIRAARRKRIPSVILPFTIPNVLELAEDCLAKKTSWLLRLDERVAALAYPRWTMRHKGRLLLRANPGLIDALERRRLAPPNPWMTNSGYADRIAVESERMLDVYRNADFPERQLVLTGSCADDLLHAALHEKEARRVALFRELGLAQDRPMLLSSLVPDQLGSGVPCCEFKQYDALIEFWVSTLAAWTCRMNVVLKINPRYRREQFLYLEKWGVTVAPHDTIELVPLAEIYVTSISSTLRWAVACGIPSINYDVYHYRYDDFADVAGIVHVEKKEEFSAAVARLVEDEGHRGELRRLQLSQAQRWARLDGRSTERLASLFDELCAGGGSRSVVGTS
jgi:hypothetical protein